MTQTAISLPSRSLALPTWLSDLGLSLAICLFVYATYAASGFPTLADPGGDNDSMLRLVEIHDLLGGQGWYDLQQYRIGPEGGVAMHWSRLIDAPVAALFLLASGLGASAPLAETIALTLWPLFLMVMTLFGLMQLARRLGDEHTMLPAVTLGAGALYFVGIYRPGSVDHHNAQIALTVAMIVFLTHPRALARFGAVAGGCAALMLAIGMETVPYVAIGGAGVALAFLFSGRAEASRAAGFGLGFAGTAAAAFLATVGPSRWAVPACDALSNVQLTLALFAGLGLAGIALLPAAGASFGRRLVALALLGAAFAAVATLNFSQCLADPYAMVDARLREIWLDKIAEVQSVAALIRIDWTDLLIYYLTPALAILVLGVHMLRHGATRAKLVYGGFLVAVFLVSCWQVRGSSFAVPLATAALALGVGELREKALGKAPLFVVASLLAWLASFNIFWSAIGHNLSTHQVAVAALPSTKINCAERTNFAHLAGLPQGTVLAVSDLGSPILMNTPHRVLAAPYHRNIAGNLAMIDAMLSSPDEAAAIVRDRKVDYVVLCRGNAENRNLVERASAGFLADLLAGRLPAWLAIDLATAGQPIEIYRVSPST